MFVDYVDATRWTIDEIQSYREYRQQLYKEMNTKYFLEK